MARSFSLLATVSTLALYAVAAPAQNYVAPHQFSGPNVVIDFGTLDQASSAPNQWAVAPITQEPLTPPAPPPKLTPPPARQVMRMTPVSPAPMTTAQPTMMPDSQPIIAPLTTTQDSAKPPASLQDRMASADMTASPPVTPPRAGALPPPTPFSAHDMIDSAPPAPPVSAAAMPSAPAKTPAPSFAATKTGVADTDRAGKTGSMLTQARKNSSEKADRVNLASISDGPPMPMRNTQQAALSQPVAAARTDKPQPKAVAHPMAPMAALPPGGSLNDLDAPETNGMKDVIAQATTEPDTIQPIATKPEAPKQMASLPPANKPLRDLDTDNRPASQASAPDKQLPKTGQQASLHFAKDAGTLDDAAKKELDGMIKALKSDPNARAQIRAYASGTPETSGQARRLSLTRALAARSYVLDQDVPATRLDIRALGNGQGGLDKPESGDLDRVDITLLK